MSRWQGRLEHKQGFLARIVDIGAEIFAMAAVCVRADMIRSTDPAQGEAAYELADLFCKQSRLRVEELFGRLWHNTDDEDGELTKRLLEGRYAWAEEGVLDPSGDGPWIAPWEPGESTAENVHRRIN